MSVDSQSGKLEEEIIGDIIKNITVPFCSRNINKALLAFSSALMQKGVAKQAIMDALAVVKPQLATQADEVNVQCQAAVRYFNERKEMEKMITDFLGRAIISRVEGHFPVDAETCETILKQPVPGFIPREISSGLIDAIKFSHGDETLEEYEKVANARADKHRRKTDRLVDLKAFLGDQEMRQLVDKMIRQFRAVVDKKSSEDRKRWILTKITTGSDFSGMKRDLVDEEYALLLKDLLG
ncbi:MAG: hypothetical protein HY751_03785 [Nitrospinae bacterium]|nr:hypothetical protein [Nitrospinota bacterium]